MGPMGTNPAAHVWLLQGISRHDDPSDPVSSLTVPGQQLRGAVADPHKPTLGQQKVEVAFLCVGKHICRVLYPEM